MLMALLFDEEDQIVAAAPACDFTACGQNYWNENYPQRLVTAHTETAVIEVVPPLLRDALLGLMRDYTELEQCRNLWTTYFPTNKKLIAAKFQKAA